MSSSDPTGDVVEITPGVHGPISGEPDVSEPFTPPPSADVPVAPVVGSEGGGPRRQLLLAKVELDSAVKYWASREVIHPSHTYEGRVTDWGLVDRSISVPASDFQGGESRIRVADTGLEIRDELATQTALRRTLSMRLVPEGESESAHEPFLIHEIKDFERVAGAYEFSGRDPSFVWMDKEIHGLGNRTNFQDLMDGVDEIFIPIWFGIVNAPPQGSPPVEQTQGILTLPRMTLTRWGLSQTHVVSVSIVRKLPDEAEFSLVDSSEYELTEEPHTFDGIFYEFLTFLDFLSEQPLGTEIRVLDLHSFNFRGAYQGVPESSSDEALRNPVDWLVAVLSLALSGELDAVGFNTASFISVFEAFETMLATSPAEGYKCDTVIPERMTFREFVGTWCRNFECHAFPNGQNELTLSLGEDDDTGPILSDGPGFGDISDQSLILINSVRHRPADPCVTRLRMNYAQNYVTRQWGIKQVFDNESDQAILKGTSSRSGIIEGYLDMPFVRDSATALSVAARRMQFLSLGSYRIELDAPMPEVAEIIELAKIARVTRYDGLSLGGYQRAKFKISGITHDLNQRKTTVRGVLRAPVVIRPLTTSCPVGTPVAGELFTVLLTVSGGLGPYIFTLLDGPDGMEIGGPLLPVLSWDVPIDLPAGTYAYSFQVQDSAGQTASIECEFTTEEPEEPEELGFTGPSIFQMATRSHHSSNTQEVVYQDTLLRFNPDWFTSEENEIFIELDGWNTHATNDYDIIIEDTDGNVAHTFTVPANTDPQATFIETFTPLSGERTYRVRLSQTEVGHELRFDRIDIRIEFVNETTPVFMISFDGNSRAVNTVDLVAGDNRFLIDTGDTGYVAESELPIFYKDVGAYSVVDHWSLESVMGNTNGGINATAYVALGQSGGPIVVSNDHTGPISFVTQDFAHDDFEEGNDFEIFTRLTSNGVSVNTIYLRSSIYVFYSDFTSGNIYYNTARTLHLPSFSPQATGIYSDATLKEPSSGNQVLNTRRADSFGGTHTAITGAALDPTSTSKTHYRSSAFSTTGPYFDAQVSAGTGSVTIQGTWIMTTVPEP